VALPELIASSSPKKDVTGKMEEALDLLARFGPEYHGGLANHAPMVADALMALGREEAVLPWVERYSRQLDAHPTPRNPISLQEWRSALGDFARSADWVIFFQNQLKEETWRNVLARWVPLLSPGLAAAAAHGLLRTAHITRRLTEKETRLRLNELAEGLGYWASRYQTLPQSKNASNVKKMKASEAIRFVKFLPEKQRADGLITDRLHALGEFAPFADVIDLIDDSMAPTEILSDLTRTFAQIYLINPRRYLIAFVHAVTGPSSIRILLPYLPPEGVSQIIRYGWQLAAAIYATNGEKVFDGVSNQEVSADDLIDRAVAAEDEHAIKFTEACLREHHLKPHPIYLAAARNACDQLAR
jgi:hypothetical protein